MKRIFDDGYRLIRVGREELYSFNHNKVPLSCLIGVPYGSILELKKSEKSRGQNVAATLCPVKLTEEEMFEVSDLNSIDVSQEGEGDAPDPLLSSVKDNRNLVDDGSSQKLSMEEIEDLKEQQLATNELVDTIVKHSVTFDQKSAFSQAKYIKKKRQKYTNTYKMYKPSVRLLCDMYFISGPQKITNLRVDSLAQMLTAVNVRSGGRYIVVDNYLGLLAAAVVERLVGEGTAPIDERGKCIQCYLEQGPCGTWRTCVDALNIPPDALSQVLVSCSINQLWQWSSAKEEERAFEKEMEVEKATSETSVPKNEEPSDGDDLDPQREAKRRKLDEKWKRKKQRKEEERVSESIIRTKTLDGFLMLCRNFDPSSVVDVLLEVISPSAPFAIYCHVMEPLCECMIHLRTSDKAVNVRLSETWLREYQVLPGRTRPNMNMNGSGGFILTGTKVA